MMDGNEAPPISALFLVIFDQKVGYTIAWKQSLPDVDVESVEYKCLPSGLHGVQSDLVYFVHGDHGGVSAFAQGWADAQHRNASFAAVGALVSLHYGKLGRGWLHAAQLKELAREVVTKRDDTRVLELYWQKHRGHDTASKGQSGAAGSPPSSRRHSAGFDRKRKRSVSDATEASGLRAAITPDHPALSMLDLLDIFGPLTYPLYRAAVLRKRILLLGSPPVQNSCNYIYDLSVLSSIPLSTAEALPLDSAYLHRCQALFSVGIHDIPVMESKSGPGGWLATTTDDILGEKKQLYDLLVELPSTLGQTDKQQWPKLRTSDGRIVKATQRDLRRYAALRRVLTRLQRAPAAESTRYADHLVDDGNSEHNLLPRSITSMQEQHEANELGNYGGEVVESASWTSAAYRSFMWWASAGEQDALEAEETAADQALLQDLPDLLEGAKRPSSSNSSREDEADLLGLQNVALVFVAYFHRITAITMQTLADIVEEADDDTEEGIEEDEIEVSSEDMRQIGLDSWNDSDREFVQGVMRLYFGRIATLPEMGVRMCGMRFC